MKLYPGHSDS